MSSIKELEKEYKLAQTKADELKHDLELAKDEVREMYILDKDGWILFDDSYQRFKQVSAFYEVEYLKKTTHDGRIIPSQDNYEPAKSTIRRVRSFDQYENAVYYNVKNSDVYSANNGIVYSIGKEGDSGLSAVRVSFIKEEDIEAGIIYKIED